ncbi:cobyrinic acid a,c-diamide synthase [Paenibacillus sp. P3E]|uniref:cobyrinate a,c-diamide synthase n=1 Tax=Paenibacillus sp. P3E TaxID=1349435 RepID=UPI00093D5A51|nr:cobyrinate a,c-diamide synthase [Paenibacillus sp. P3E]OKP72695.1 cobyrinic acid a,c-diamide synthase [Paenibacillus sp. P3E]
MNEESRAERERPSQLRPRFVVAGTGSGSGKTTVTLGLLRAFARRGLTVQAFKCGPDYIDPAYHAAVTGRPARNLDAWMTSSEYMLEYYLRSSEAADLSVIEGVMGLYDGKEATALTGSTAEIALLTDSPVLLVVDVRSMGRSAAAIVLGFQLLEPGVHIAAVIVNCCGSASHYRTVKAAIEVACHIPVIGWLERDRGLDIPERHLGLLPAVERGELEPLFDRAADLLEAGTDLDLLLELAAAAPALRYPKAKGLGSDEVSAAGKPSEDTPQAMVTAYDPAPVIAVARDAAFNFYYADNLELLAQAGARLAYFSPLSGEGVPPQADGIYIGGGFPEEFAAGIAGNSIFMDGLRAAAAAGMPLYAECGGYMVLARSLTDRSGAMHQMAGIIPADTVMQKQRAALGYREVTARADCLLLKQGERLRGHEFHYSQMNYAQGESQLYAYDSHGRSGSQPEGYVSGNVMAAYAHIHLASYFPAAARLVEACRIYRGRKTGFLES